MTTRAPAVLINRFVKDVFDIDHTQPRCYRFVKVKIYSIVFS